MVNGSLFVVKKGSRAMYNFFEILDVQRLKPHSAGSKLDVCVSSKGRGVLGLVLPSFRRKGPGG